MEHPSLPPSEFDRPPRNKGEGLVLCLSGGGFRATFFHLGVVRYLAAIDELRRVTDIYAVSGGSILAAHLAQRWDDYKDQKTFNAAADELRELADWDVRGRIVRKWLLGACFGLPLCFSRFRREQLLIDEYRTVTPSLSVEGRFARC
jgi:predicted acylesterase/phospholipase RssA